MKTPDITPAFAAVLAPPFVVTGTPPERVASAIANMTHLAASADPLAREYYTQQTLRKLAASRAISGPRRS